MVKRAGALIEVSDLFTEEEFTVIEQLRRAGAHSTHVAAIRSAMWFHGLHYSRQGLMDAPAVDVFKISAGKTRRNASNEHRRKEQRRSTR